MKQTIRRRLTGNVSPDGLGRLTLTRGDSYALELGLFEADGSTPADLTNVLRLVFEMYSKEGDEDQLGTSVTVKASAMNLTMTQEQWIAGTAETATVALTSAQTDIAVTGEARVRAVWGVVYGMLWDGDRRTYAEGTVFIRKATASGTMGVLDADNVFLRDNSGDQLSDDEEDAIKTDKTA